MGSKPPLFSPSYTSVESTRTSSPPGSSIVRIASRSLVHRTTSFRQQQSTSPGSRYLVGA
eukprot:3941692-Rhodomonas_salina.2